MAEDTAIMVLRGTRRRLEDSWAPLATGGECLINAAIDAFSYEIWRPGEDNGPLRAVYSLLAQQVAPGSDLPAELTIQMWNDEPGRTKEEVLAVIDAALLSAEAAPR